MSVLAPRPPAVKTTCRYGRLPVLDRMRQRQAKLFLLPTPRQPMTQLRERTPGKAAARNLLRRAGEQARQLREHAARFAAEDATGQAPPVEAAAPEDWRDRVLRMRVKLLCKLLAAAVVDPTAENLAHVADLCRRLERMALACLLRKAGA